MGAVNIHWNDYLRQSLFVDHSPGKGIDHPSHFQQISVAQFLFTAISIIRFPVGF